MQLQWEFLLHFQFACHLNILTRVNTFRDMIQSIECSNINPTYHYNRFGTLGDTFSDLMSALSNSALTPPPLIRSNVFIPWNRITTALNHRQYSYSTNNVIISLPLPSLDPFVNTQRILQLLLLLSSKTWPVGFFNQYP